MAVTLPDCSYCLR
jgi:hypothetical protein